MQVAASGKLEASWWQREASNHTGREVSCSFQALPVLPPSSSCLVTDKNTKMYDFEVNGVVIVTHSEGVGFSMAFVMTTVQVWKTEPPEIEEMKIKLMMLS